MNTQNKKRILITGSQGFIATHLRERLEQLGHEVIGIDDMRNPCRYHRGDFINISINDFFSMLDVEKQIEKVDIVYHLAAEINVEKSLEDPYEVFRTNFDGTLLVLDACTKAKRPLIVASSAEIYGSAQEEWIAEKHPTNPHSPYASSKLAADGTCKAYYKSYGSKVIIVRNFNTFGKYQSDNKYGAAIGIFSKQALANEPITIFGNGEQSRDYMGYKDAIDFYIKLLDRDDLYGEEFNVGSGFDHKIIDIAYQIKQLTNSSSEIVFQKKRPGEVWRLTADSSKAKKVLGWEPETDFPKLLREYIDWRVEERRFLNGSA